VATREEDFVSISIAFPKRPVALFNFFQVLEDRADGKQFLLHRADDTDLHLTIPLNSWCWILGLYHLDLACNRSCPPTTTDARKYVKDRYQTLVIITLSLLIVMDV